MLYFIADCKLDFMNRFPLVLKSYRDVTCNPFVTMLIIRNMSFILSCIYYPFFHFTVVDITYEFPMSDVSMISFALYISLD